MEPTHVIDEVKYFQHRFKNRAVGRENLFKSSICTPMHAHQIETSVIHFMANSPALKGNECGYWERIGEKHERELEQKQEATEEVIVVVDGDDSAKKKTKKRRRQKRRNIWLERELHCNFLRDVLCHPLFLHMITTRCSC